MFPKNDTVFYLTVVEAEISFSMTDGLVENLTLFQDGQEALGKKIE
jgi:D-alanyl-D-alanine-carboxypeptidase/D-alanyl-D-alanine-endopeptidase